MTGKEYLIKRTADMCKRIRTDHKITQNEMAALLGTTQSNVSKFERGEITNQLYFLIYLSIEQGEIKV